MTILKSYLETCADAFDHTPGYPLADRILKMAFTSHPKNISPEEVLLKVALLNSLYRTNIFDVYGIAEHVLAQKIDKYLEKGKIEAVDYIRKGHRYKTKNKEIDFYSFATKYCHWHRPDYYPMFDKYVSKALQWLNLKLKIYPKLLDEYLRNYELLKTTIDLFKKILKLNWEGYKRFDQALWILGQLIVRDADKQVLQFVKKLPDEI
jgi:hypothetical protein